ncbi:hypothetical protein HG470_001110 [Candidatus Saccharibacteria bacterium]|nr:hypothetical protein [Candidatus Saccharibacteria bacterium]
MSNLLFASELGKRPQVARLTEPHTAGSGIFTCESLSGWAGECSFVIYEVDSSGNPISGSETDWIGTKNNRNLENLELTAGVDRDYPVDRTYLVATETAGGRNKLIQGLKNTLNDDGTLKAGVVDLSKIPDGSVTATKIAHNSINNDKIADNSLDGRKLLDNSIPLTKIKEDYSKDRVEIGTWLGVKKVYRRVITGTGDVPASIPFEKFTVIVRSEMVVKNQGAGRAWRMIPWLFNGNDLNWYGGYYFLEDNRTIAVQLGNEIKKAVNWHIIVEYCID